MTLFICSALTNLSLNEHSLSFLSSLQNSMIHLIKILNVHPIAKTVTKKPNINKNESERFKINTQKDM